MKWPWKSERRARRERWAAVERRLDRIRAGEELDPYFRAEVSGAYLGAGSPAPGTCMLPTTGYFCTLEAGHDGPCPAWPRWVREPYLGEWWRS